MYGETDVMRHRADQLVGQTDRIAWTGRAADAMRERARQRATALRECAQRYESAADALDRHADDVDRLKDAIAQRERRAGALVADARARKPPVDEDLVLRHFTPPAPGHRDWLTVELPGL
jgi:hypothetical protein